MDRIHALSFTVRHEALYIVQWSLNMVGVASTTDQRTRTISKVVTSLAALLAAAIALATASVCVDNKP